MTEPTYKYDESSDTLYISFAPGEKATGIELNPNILLRINKIERRAVGITIFNYSYLAQKTSAGLRSLPLTGLVELSSELQELVLDILSRAPVKEILTTSSYTPSRNESIPIASLQPNALAVA
ncbi:MAG: DUF2283 domain-containing protein [Chloroflexi bacterium]|nr:DUF2283 domain-containing protein [Chloroflexota bacterium]